MKIIDNMIKGIQNGVNSVNNKFDAATAKMNPSTRQATKIMSIALAVGLFSLLAPKVLVVAVSLAAIAGICYVNRDVLISFTEDLAMQVRAAFTHKPVRSK